MSLLLASNILCNPINENMPGSNVHKLTAIVFGWRRMNFALY